MRLRLATIAVIAALALLLSGMHTVLHPSLPAAEAAPAIPVEHLLNSDGTLRLDGTFSGALDVSGWQVALDPQRGPVLQSLASGSGQWTNLGGSPDGALNPWVSDLAVSGSDVYVGGGFTDAAGNPAADYVARFDTTTNTWHALGSNGSGDGALNGVVSALAMSGSDLYVSGAFTNAAGIPEADYMARWDGSTWHAFGSNGSGNGVLNDAVFAIAVSGNDVYVGGRFTNAAGIPAADYVARFDTTTNTWHALGSNGSGDGMLNDWVSALAVSGSDVYVGGRFTDAAGLPAADYVARFDTATNTWHALGSNGSGNGVLNDGVSALAVSGSDVYVGGWFLDAAGNPAADYVARFDTSTTTWHALGSNGSGDGMLNDWVSALAVSGSDVYVGGRFTDAAGIPQADYVARWDGSTWHALGSRTDGVLKDLDYTYTSVYALAVSGSNVYVGGWFQNAAGIPQADYVARWDGSTWNALGSGTDGVLKDLDYTYTSVYALAVSGSDVYVGGNFTDAADIPAADYVARFDTTTNTWHALGSNSNGDGALNSSVSALAVSGSDVYVGGRFTDAAGLPAADYVARFDTATNTWHALGSNGSGDGALGSETLVRALAVSGSNVYVGGWFIDAAGIPAADCVARFDTATNTWHPLGSGALMPSRWEVVYALAVSDSNVYVGGEFTEAAGIPEANYVARFDTATNTWHALGSSALWYDNWNLVRTLAVSGSDVYVGGRFTDAAGIPEADYVARFDTTTNTWHALGSDGNGNGALKMNGWQELVVHAIAVSGSDVYVGGGFTNAAGIPAADYVARFDTTTNTWHALGDGALNFEVDALAVSGNDVYVGGKFINAAGIPAADRVAAYAIPPSVQAITRINPNPASAASVQFQVTFDEPVVGVDAADFALTTTGTLSGASVTNVSGSGATYTVTVAIGAGAGTLRLDIPASATISDLAGLSVNNLPFTTGESYLIPARIYVPLVQR